MLNNSNFIVSKNKQLKNHKITQVFKKNSKIVNQMFTVEDELIEKEA